jgi:hypothetical protein
MGMRAAWKRMDVEFAPVMPQPDAGESRCLSKPCIVRRPGANANELGTRDRWREREYPLRTLDLLLMS